MSPRKFPSTAATVSELSVLSLATLRGHFGLPFTLGSFATLEKLFRLHSVTNDVRQDKEPCLPLRRPPLTQEDASQRGARRPSGSGISRAGPHGAARPPGPLQRKCEDGRRRRAHAHGRAFRPPGWLLGAGGSSATSRPSWCPGRCSRPSGINDSRRGCENLPLTCLACPCGHSSSVTSAPHPCTPGDPSLLLGCTAVSHAALPAGATRWPAVTGRAARPPLCQQTLTGQIPF